MTKIGVDGRTFSVPNPGGAVRNGLELTKGLHKQDADVTVFGHSRAKDRLNKVPVVTYGYIRNSKSLGMAWEQTLLPKGASNLGIDVLYSPVAYCPLVPTPFKCAITIHDLSSFEGHSAGWYNKFERALLPVMASRSDLVLTVSEFSKQQICSELDVNESKIQVVHNGVNELFLSDEQPDISLELPDSYILYVGAMSTRKNISGIFEAFRILKEEYQMEQELVLIGPEDDPTNESDIDSETLDPIKEHIHQLGYVSDLELKQAYGSADVFAFPSFYEGFGMPPLEAMACGTPVVASDRTAIPEVLGDAARYVNPDKASSIADGIKEVLSDSKVQNELIRKGAVQSRKYQWEESATQLRQFLSMLS